MSLMTTRRELMQWNFEIPPQYKRIEYLESNGTQYLITDFVPPVNAEARTIFQYSKGLSGDDMIWGFNTRSLSIYLEFHSTYHYYAAIGLSRYLNVGYEDPYWRLQIHETTLNANQLDNICNGERPKNVPCSPTEYRSEYANPLPIYLFAWNNDGRAQYVHRGLRLFSLMFTADDVPIAHFIPCIHIPTNKPGMYDTVARKFYINAGTGEFIVPAEGE